MSQFSLTPGMIEYWEKRFPLSFRHAIHLKDIRLIIISYCRRTLSDLIAHLPDGSHLPGGTLAGSLSTTIPSLAASHCIFCVMTQVTVSILAGPSADDTTGGLYVDDAMSGQKVRL